MTTRRDFLKTTTGVGVGAAIGVRPGRIVDGAPALHLQRTTPVAVASANGLGAVETALAELAAGASTVDAVVRGVNQVEEDPEDTSVGYGGLPNAHGVVQLDSSVMHGPSRGAGAVAALEDFINPSRVALDVMRYTDHVLLVGEGAHEFALSMGYEPRNLLTEETRRIWVRWRARLSDEDDWLTPAESGEPVEGLPERGGGTGGALDQEEWELLEKGMLDSADGYRPYGTINCNLVDADGDISGVTTTSGLAWKIPGRVGDSPIVGAGLYVDNDVGAAGSTGRGEAVIKTCGSHSVVELMRQGMSPQDACLEALRRVVRWTTEERLLTEDGRPDFNVSYYAVNKAGEYAGASIWSGARFSVNVGGDARHEDSAYLFERS
ncbi:MAG: N(4)-(beta-N-acetylglucosaminyl)-L-asparaginase [Gemmatimonadota bacterium]|jgi:N4-(beta-N-acetylglucosaminyl)-L-asparaginase